MYPRARNPYAHSGYWATEQNIDSTLYEIQLNWMIMSELIIENYINGIFCGYFSDYYIKSHANNTPQIHKQAHTEHVHQSPNWNWTVIDCLWSLLFSFVGWTEDHYSATVAGLMMIEDE